MEMCDNHSLNGEIPDGDHTVIAEFGDCEDNEL